MFSILFYLVLLVLLVVECRKLFGADEKSLEYQRRLELRMRNSSLIPSKKVFTQALVASISVTTLLLIIAIVGYVRSIR